MFKFVPIFAALVILTVGIEPAFAQSDAVKRGQYIFTASGCAGCHTDTKGKQTFLAGGHPLKTPFGTYYGPNITRDKTHGIGNWSDEDFIRALREGKAPDGSHYFPVFPYTSFTKMTDQDMKDLKAYLFSVPPSDKPNIPHDIDFPFNIRLTMIGWKLLFFDEGVFTPDPDKDKTWNRGAYLAEAMVHCGECHTPRNILGATKSDMAYAGNKDGPKGDLAPNITPDEETGIGKWSHKAIVEVLQIGILPDGDFVGGTMAEVTENMGKLTEGDLKAIASYFKALPAIRNKVTGK